MNEILKVADGVRFQIQVLPKASKNQIKLDSNGKIKLWLTAPPIDGKANDACINFLSKLLGIPKRSISILIGDKSKYKTIILYGEPELLYNKLVDSLKND